MPKGTILARVYFTAGRHPTRWNEFRHYGPTNARFDHQVLNARNEPFEQDRSVFYCATDAKTCLAEVFQETRVIDRSRKAPWLVVFELARGVTLVDLTASYPTRAGASMAINSRSRVRARAWAQAFYQAYPKLQGIYYASSMHGNAPAVALTDRVEAAAVLPTHPMFNRALTDDAMLDPLKYCAADLRYGLR